MRKRQSTSRYVPIRSSPLPWPTTKQVRSYSRDRCKILFEMLAEDGRLPAGIPGPSIRSRRSVLFVGDWRAF
eukprot:162604-Amorphochlora_amoeboformis.AAC.1